MASRNGSNIDCKVYVGELGYGAAKQELEDAFSRYGPLRSVWIARNPAGFAFIEFEDPRDVHDACKALDGTRINGREVRVEASNGKTRWRDGPPRRGGRGGGGDRSRGGDRYGGGGDRYGGGGDRYGNTDRYRGGDRFSADRGAPRRDFGGRSRDRSPPRRRFSPSPRRSSFRSRSRSPIRGKRTASKSPERRSSGRREWD